VYASLRIVICLDSTIDAANLVFNRGHGVVVNIPALGAGDRGFKDSRYRSPPSGGVVTIAQIPLSSDRSLYIPYGDMLSGPYR